MKFCLEAGETVTCEKESLSDHVLGRGQQEQGWSNTRCSSKFCCMLDSINPLGPRFRCGLEFKY